MSASEKGISGVHKKLRDISKEVSDIKFEISALRKAIHIALNSLSPDEILSVMDRKPGYRNKSQIGRNKEARALAVSLLRDGCTCKAAAEQINKKIAGFSTSRSAVSRFWSEYRKALWV